MSARECHLQTEYTYISLHMVLGAPCEKSLIYMATKKALCRFLLTPGFKHEPHIIWFLCPVLPALDSGLLLTSDKNN